jgi:hypothetical protein
MKRLFKTLIVTVLICSVFNGEFSLGQTTTQKSRPVIGIFLAGVGILITFFNSKEKKVWVFSWLLISAGTFATTTRVGWDVIFAENTELDLFSGKTLEAKLEVAPALERIEMDSLALVSHPELAGSLPVSEVLTQLNQTPVRIGQLIVAAKGLGDKLLSGKEVGDRVLVVNKDILNQQMGPLTIPESTLVKNYLRLRNIAI